jgi:hypothetical protein
VWAGFIFQWLIHPILHALVIGPLKMQIQWALFGGSYVDFLKKLGQQPHLNKLLHGSQQDKSSSKLAQTLLLRFFALWRHGPAAFSGTTAAVVPRHKDTLFI